MKFIRFFGWLVAAVTIMFLIGGSVHSLFANLMPCMNIDGNTATAAGYTMEVVLSAAAFVLIIYRLLWALEIVENFSEVTKVLATRTAILSLGVSGLVGMGFINRFFWWAKHMFTDTAFNYNPDVYAGAANSVITSLLMCVIVYALHASSEAEPKERGHLLPQGLSVAVSLWLLGWVSFIGGAVMYTYVS